MHYVTEFSSQEGEDLYEDDPRWQLLQRILATPDFVRSPRLADFLRYATRVTLAGDAASLSEQHIGEAVFGRPPSYDSSADTIVRSHALRLRRKLQQYFLLAGEHEPLWLDMPRGSYAVVFMPSPRAAPEHSGETALPTPELPAEDALLAPPAPPARPEITVPPVDPPHTRGRLWLFLSVAVVAVAVLVAVTLHLRRPANTGPSQHLLWGRIFASNAPTRIVLGDSGLVLFHAVTHQYISLGDYLQHNYEPHMQHLEQVDPRFALFLTSRRYTSMVDANAEIRLTRLPEAAPDRTLLQYARDMRLNDFKNGSLILLGAQESDPWVELFEHSMDFIFSGPVPGRPAAFLNRKPKNSEPTAYRMSSDKSKTQVYAVIAFLPNLDAIRKCPVARRPQHGRH